MAAVTKPKVERTRPTELVDWALSGRIRIPRFQRPFRWEKDDVLQLFDSIFRGYPVGNLLMWRRPAAAGRFEIGPITVQAAETADAFWVVDGQQRITSLVSALAAPDDAVDPKFRIFFDLRAERFVSAGRRDRVPRHWLPMPVTLRNEDVLRWQRERPNLTDEELRRCDAVVTAIRDYEIPMYILEGDNERQVTEVFKRVNNSGKHLTRAEVFGALRTVSGQMEPSGLDALSARVEGFGFGQFTDQVLMQSVLAVRGGKIDRDFRREFSSDEDRHQAFALAERAIGDVVDFLREEARVPHIRLLPHSLYVPVLTRFTALFGPPKDRAAELLRRWIWRGAAIGAAPQGNTVAVRRNTAAVYDEPVGSADRLLGLLPPGGERWVPDLSRTRLNSSQAKLNILALLDQRPAALVGDGGADFITHVLQEHQNPLAVIISPGLARTFHVASDELLGTLANRLVHPPADPDQLLSAILSADQRTLHSQCLDDESVAALNSGTVHAFLRHRAELLRVTIAENVQSHALFGFRDGPDLRSLFDGKDDSHAA